MIVFEKFRFQNVFRPHENEKPAFSKFSSLKSIFKNLRFRDGLVWTVGLTVEIKLAFSNFSGVGWTGLGCHHPEILLDFQSSLLFLVEYGRNDVPLFKSSFKVTSSHFVSVHG